MENYESQKQPDEEIKKEGVDNEEIKKEGVDNEKEKKGKTEALYKLYTDIEKEKKIKEWEDKKTELLGAFTEEEIKSNSVTHHSVYKAYTNLQNEIDKLNKETWAKYDEEPD